METLYRKVAVSERLPEKPSFNFIKYTCGSTDSAFFSIKENKFYARRKDIEFWLEEIPDNSQQIEKLEAEKKELLEALEKVIVIQDKYFGEQEIHSRLRAFCVQIESLIKKHKATPKI